jgi:bifunctional UDP-N-acetylglucosamine pyrophosphorylase/glucosamine-1-phosphate N-acetyltransferase
MVEHSRGSRSPSVAVGVVILAAGQGKRMQSELPKVLHSLSGKSLILTILNRISAASPQSSVSVVVGHSREKVIREIQAAGQSQVEFAVQAEQLGTGHALKQAMDTPWGHACFKAQRPILVLPGDLPLISPELIAAMMEPLGRGVAMRVLTTEVEDSSGYGRIVRRGKAGGILKIVEERDANARQREIKEVNSSIYLFDPGFLKAALPKIKNKNAQKEFYLTDLVALAVGSRKRVDLLLWQKSEEIRGINDPWELALADRISNRRILERHARAGVRFLDIDTTRIEADVQIGCGTEIGSGVQLNGTTEIGKDCTIGPHVVIENSKIAAHVTIKAGTVIQQSSVDSGASLGPYAHLRPDSHVGSKAKIGNFVELKKASIGAETSVAHLSYLGDAEVGSHTNIGCGFVTCNFDGRVIDGSRKHKTRIGSHVFMGSDCQTIAPITVGDGAYVASGSTITEDVAADSLAIARSRQVNKPGYAKKLRKKDGE